MTAVLVRIQDATHHILDTDPARNKVTDPQTPVLIGLIHDRSLYSLSLILARLVLAIPLFSFSFG